MTQPQEVLRVTEDGQFIWHEDADRMIVEGDFSHAPAMQHMLKALRNKRQWQGLTDEDLDYLCHLAYAGDEEFALTVQAKLKEKNT